MVKKCQAVKWKLTFYLIPDSSTGEFAVLFAPANPKDPDVVAAAVVPSGMPSTYIYIYWSHLSKLTFIGLENWLHSNQIGFRGFQLYPQNNIYEFIISFRFLTFPFTFVSVCACVFTVGHVRRAIRCDVRCAPHNVRQIRASIRTTMDRVHLIGPSLIPIFGELNNTFWKLMGKKKKKIIRKSIKQRLVLFDDWILDWNIKYANAMQLFTRLNLYCPSMFIGNWFIIF
jgi:hypothetical protein